MYPKFRKMLLKGNKLQSIILKSKLIRSNANLKTKTRFRYVLNRFPFISYVPLLIILHYIILSCILINIISNEVKMKTV